MFAATAFQAHRASFGRRERRYRKAGRSAFGRANTRWRCGTSRTTCSRSELCPQDIALGRARGTEPALLAGKRDDIFRTARVAPDSRETAFRHAAPQKTLDGFGNDAPKRTEGALEAQFVFARKNVEELEQDRAER